MSKIPYPPAVPENKALQRWCEEVANVLNNLDSKNLSPTFQVSSQSIDPTGQGGTLAGTFVLKAGDTMTGPLIGTSGTFTGDVVGGTGTFTGNTTSGTFTAVSTTLATNVNADLLDDHEGSEYGKYVGSGTWSGSNTFSGAFSVTSTANVAAVVSSDVVQATTGFNNNGDPGLSINVMIYDGTGAYTHSITFSGGMFAGYSTSV